MADETVQVSVCCKADAIEDFKDNPRDHHDPIEIYTCSKCQKECEVEDVCAFCLGEGEYSTDESDGEGHVMRGVGTQKCHCKMPDEDDRDNQE